MKANFKILFLLCMVFFFVPDLSAQKNLPFIFNKTVDYNYKHQDEAGVSFEVNHKILTFGDTYIDSLGIFTLCNTLLDTNGSIIQHKNFYYSYYHQYSIAKCLLHRNKEYAAGWVNNFNDSIHGGDLAFFKFDANGDTVFTRLYHDTGTLAPFDMIQLNPSVFIILCGQVHDFRNVTQTRTALVYIDTVGTILNTIYYSPSDYDARFLLHDLNRKEFYVFGYNYNNTGYYSFLKTIDDSSHALKKTFQNIGQWSNTTLCSVVMYDGKVFASFSEEVWISPIPFPGNRIKIGKLWTDGHSYFTKWHSLTPNDTGGNAGTAKLMFDKNKMIFAGFTSYTGLQYYFCDTSLNVLCKANIVAPDTNSMILFYNDNIILNSKRIYATGMTSPIRSNTNQTLSHWFYCSDNYENYLKSECYNGVSENTNNKLFDCLIYPNPSGNYLTVESLNLDYAPFEINIFNILGQAVLESQSPTEKHTINISELTSGVYIIRIFNHKRDIFQSKFIKE